MGQEIYIRKATETEARGPFNIEQVTSLAEAGQVTADTLIYDAMTEQWVELSSNATLMAVILPEKRKLTLKPKEVGTLNQPDGDTKPITVNDMLAAAEGRTADTKEKSDPQIAMARAAKIGTYGALLTLVAAAAAEILPAPDALTAMDGAKLLAHPFVVLGVVDMVFAVLLALGVINVYPLIRFRAALGFGLMGFTFYNQGLTLPLLELAVGSAGLFLCTVLTSLAPVLIASAAGIAGMASLAWYFLSH